MVELDERPSVAAPTSRLQSPKSNSPPTMTQPDAGTLSTKIVTSTAESQGRTEQVMRASLSSSSPASPMLARITCEAARKPPRPVPSNQHSLGGAPRRATLRDEPLAHVVAQLVTPPGGVGASGRAPSSAGGAGSLTPSGTRRATRVRCRIATALSPNQKLRAQPRTSSGVSQSRSARARSSSNSTRSSSLPS